MSLSPTVPHNISQWRGGTWHSSTTNIQTVKHLCGLSVHIQCHSICTVQTDVLFCSLRFLSGDLQRWRIQLFFFLCVCVFLRRDEPAVAVIQTNPRDFLSHTSHSQDWGGVSFNICCPNCQSCISPPFSPFFPIFMPLSFRVSLPLVRELLYNVPEQLHKPLQKQEWILCTRGLVMYVYILYGYETICLYGLCVFSPPHHHHLHLPESDLIMRDCSVLLFVPLVGCMSDPTDGAYISHVFCVEEHIPLGQQLPGYWRHLCGRVESICLCTTVIFWKILCVVVYDGECFHAHIKYSACT